jgi:hypothetical protein
VQGPFYLGRLSYPIAIVSTLWISFMLIVLCLPELNPVNSKTPNYAPVALGVVVVYGLGFWVISARKWFVGPVKRIEGVCHVRSNSCERTAVERFRSARRIGIKITRLCEWKYNGVLGSSVGWRYIYHI